MGLHKQVHIHPYIYYKNASNISKINLIISYLDKFCLDNNKKNNLFVIFFVNNNSTVLVMNEELREGK